MLINGGEDLSQNKSLILWLAALEVIMSLILFNYMWTFLQNAGLALSLMEVVSHLEREALLCDEWLAVLVFWLFYFLRQLKQFLRLSFTGRFTLCRILEQFEL